MNAILLSTVATVVLGLAIAFAANFPDDSVSRRGWGQAAVVLWMSTLAAGLYVLAYHLT